jgi:hypothetical protein
MKAVDKESLRKALDAAILALDDWTNTYAADFCDEARVAEARARLSANGTVFYIATVVQQCTEAKELLK